MLKILITGLITGLLPGAAFAQQPGNGPVPGRSFSGGVGVGNGIALHGGYLGPRLLAYGRVRGKWWGPAAGPGANWFGESINARSRQLEAAALLGYPVVVRKSVIYGAAGLAYVNGRQLGAYRYSIRRSGVVGEVKHFYAYRDYQALSLPLEIGVLSPALGPGHLRVGLAGQANLNSQQSVYCVLLTLWVNTKEVN